MFLRSVQKLIIKLINMVSSSASSSDMLKFYNMYVEFSAAPNVEFTETFKATVYEGYRLLGTVNAYGLTSLKSYNIQVSGSDVKLKMQSQGGNLKLYYAFIQLIYIKSE